MGAQYDSELVYHNVRREVAEQGVVYTDLESAIKGEYGDLVKKHFMKLVPPNDHKFAALHGAVWSGGSFVYVPPGVQVEIPLQSYFRLNAPGAGQFEHTLIIVDEGASLHFIEGCSAPKYNVANLHAGCVELFVGKNAKLRYSTIENWSKTVSYTHLDVYKRQVHIRLQLDENDGITVAPDVYTRDAGADHYKDTTGKTADPVAAQPAANDQSNIPESGEGLIDQENTTDPAAQAAGQTQSQLCLLYTSASVPPGVPAGAAAAQLHVLRQLFYPEHPALDKCGGFHGNGLGYRCV